jgi:hypothetical protein
MTLGGGKEGECEEEEEEDEKEEKEGVLSSNEYGFLASD